MADSPIPKNLTYTEEHVWLSLDSDVATVGISDVAQSALGDIGFVELPAVGEFLEEGGVFGRIAGESQVMSLYTPITGEVLEVNPTLEDHVRLINTHPYEGGWMIRMRVENPEELEWLLGPRDYAEMMADRKR